MKFTAAEVKNIYMGVRVNKTMHKKISALAKKNNLSIGELVRMIIAEVLEKEGK
jgi:predicted HicB family RNase H-like nuclease